VLTRRTLLWVLSGFWFFAALLQLQPFWWQPGEISLTILSNVGGGGENTVLVNPVLSALANATSNLEIPLNIFLILLFVALWIGLTPAEKVGDQRPHLRAFLVGSIVVSVLIWYATQGFGMILTGMSTDFDSGLLLVVLALAVWPRQPTGQVQPARSLFTTHEGEGAERSQEGMVGRSAAPQDVSCAISRRRRTGESSLYGLL
jgi:hypothetical protein